MTLANLIKEIRIRKQKHAIINAIKQTHNPTTNRHLSQFLGLYKSTVSKYVRECEKDNLVYRVRDNVRGRRYLIYLKEDKNVIR